MASAATVSTASASLDWSNLNVNVSESGSYTAMPDYTQSYALAKSWEGNSLGYWYIDNNPSVVQGGSEAWQNSGNAQGWATTSASTLTAATFATPIAGDYSSAEAGSLRGTEYLIGANDCTITFTVPYTFTAGADASNGAAYGYMRAWADLQYYSVVGKDAFGNNIYSDTPSWGNDVSGLQLMGKQSVFNLGTDEVLLTYTTGYDTISFSFNAKANDLIWFQAGVDSQAAAYQGFPSQPNTVPLPGAAWLLGPGLLGLLGLRRK
jgi:hypothetical protein